MTASLLLGAIGLALLLQLAIGLAIAFSRRPGADVIGAPRVPDATTELAAWQGWRPFRVTARMFEDLAQTQCSFYLAPVDGAELAPFRPGQFLTFSLKCGHADAGTIVRCYSLSDHPRPASYRVTIKRALPPENNPDAQAGVASGHFHDRVNVGDIVMAKAPAGQFTLDDDGAVPTVLIAGGIGITPMISMLHAALAAEPASQVHLLYGVRTREECAFLPELEALANTHPGFKMYLVFSRVGANSLPGQLSGRIDFALLHSVLPPGRNRYYLCGPPAMLVDLTRDLRASGVSDADIRFEAFGPAAPGLAPASLADTATVPVQFKRSGRTLQWDGRDANLLDFAERHGIAIESGCRVGSCGTCSTRILSGGLRYLVKPDHPPTAGYGLLCIGRPADALVLDA